MSDFWSDLGQMSNVRPNWDGVVTDLLISRVCLIHYKLQNMSTTEVVAPLANDLIISGGSI